MLTIRDLQVINPVVYRIKYTGNAIIIGNDTKNIIVETVIEFPDFSNP